MDRTEAQLYVGQVFAGRYEVQALLGSGAFSGVFRSRDLTNQELVAVKILSLASSQNQDAVLEFQEEARLLRMLEGCSNVVRLLDQSQHILPIQVKGSPVTVPMAASFMVLELATVSLVELLLRRHELEWRDRLHLYREVVKAAHQMHRARVVHRDIKSDNVLVFDATPPAAKLSDLGRSKDTRNLPRASEGAYQVGRGDPRFAPPEFLWLQGQAEPFAHMCADLYLLGSVLFEFATGIGLTAVALGDPGAVLAHAIKLSPEDRERQYKDSIPALRDEYELAYDVFRDELPPAIAHDAVGLLRQLTDPEPALRVPRLPVKRLPTVWDLEWLLRRVDILLKRLDVSGGAARSFRRGKVRK